MALNETSKCDHWAQSGAQSRARCRALVRLFLPHKVQQRTSRPLAEADTKSKGPKGERLSAERHPAMQSAMMAQLGCPLGAAKARRCTTALRSSVVPVPSALARCASPAFDWHFPRMLQLLVTLLGSPMQQVKQSICYVHQWPSYMRPSVAPTPEPRRLMCCLWRIPRRPALSRQARREARMQRRQVAPQASSGACSGIRAITSAC